MKRFDTVKIILALAPTVLISPGFQPALFQSVAVVIVYWLTACFFKWTRLLFPGHLLEAALILWLAAWIYISEVLVYFPVFWILSVFILLPNRGVTNVDWKVFLRSIVFQGGLFWVLAISAGALKEILFRRWEPPLFQSPAGPFFILFTFVFLWQFLPRKK